MVVSPLLRAVETALYALKNMKESDFKQLKWFVDLDMREKMTCQCDIPWYFDKVLKLFQDFGVENVQLMIGTGSDGVLKSLDGLVEDKLWFLKREKDANHNFTELLELL